LSSGGWTAVRIRTPNDRTAIINALFTIGAEGVQELDDELVTHLRGIDRQSVSAALRAVDSAVKVDFAQTPEVDWADAWRSGITAHRVGSLVVTPPWLADGFSEHERIVIDPGMAFGTGEHETTRSVLYLASSIVRPGDTVADLGAGSAVLSIAAAKLGAQRVVAIELDAEAIDNAEANVRRNGVGGRVSVLEGDARVLLPLVAPVRVVLANIISSALVELLPTMASSLDANGVAILGGILIDEADDLQKSLERGGWSIIETDQQGMWWTVAASR
jgi:ribosomal protein L11 methyltransferase